MRFFKELGIFHKIIAILAVAILTFVVNLAINISSISKNQVILKSVQNTAIHLVNLTSENVTVWQRIDEIYTQSVSFGDEDLITQAGNMYNSYIANVDKIKALEGSPKVIKNLFNKLKYLWPNYLI